jgi:hypothetical protein
MTGQKLKEFMRRLGAEGYHFTLDKNGAGAVLDGDASVNISESGSVAYSRNNERLAFSVRDIRDEVDEYVTAYQNAAPGDNGKTRTLLKFNGAELAARELVHGGMDFVTWRLDRNGKREIGHYLDSYTEAKEDFALRAGLIDRNKMFSETELTVIRSNLSDYMELDGGENISGKDERAMQSVIQKIDDIIVPEVRAEAEQDEEQFDDEQEFQ